MSFDLGDVDRSTPAFPFFARAESFGACSSSRLTVSVCPSERLIDFSVYKEFTKLD